MASWWVGIGRRRTVHLRVRGEVAAAGCWPTPSWDDISQTQAVQRDTLAVCAPRWRYIGPEQDRREHLRAPLAAAPGGGRLRLTMVSGKLSSPRTLLGNAGLSRLPFDVSWRWHQSARLVGRQAAADSPRSDRARRRARAAAARRRGDRRATRPARTRGFSPGLVARVFTDVVAGEPVAIGSAGPAGRQPDRLAARRRCRHCFDQPIEPPRQAPAPRRPGRRTRHHSPSTAWR